jgi:hypothetical protein
MKRLAAALAGSAALLAIQTLVFQVTTGGAVIVALHLAFAAVDLALLLAFWRLRREEPLATLGALLAAYELGSDVLGALGHASRGLAELASAFAFAEPLVSLGISIAALLVLRAFVLSRGARFSVLFSAAVFLVVLGLFFRAQRLVVSGSRTELDVWLSWGAEVARVALVSAIAFAAARLPMPAAPPGATGPAGGPYRQAEPMPPSGDPTWALAGAALSTFRAGALARVLLPVLGAGLLFLAMLSRADALAIVAMLLVVAGRVATGGMMFLAASRASRTCPSEGARGLRVVSRILAFGAFGDGLALLGVLIMAGQRYGEPPMLLFGFAASLVAGAIALPFAGRSLAKIAVALGADHAAELARAVQSVGAMMAVAAPVALLLSMAVADLARILGAFAALFALAAWLGASIVNLKVLAEVIKAIQIRTASA